jgi:hypothetical protein
MLGLVPPCFAVCFFMVQLVRSSIGRRTRQYLILLCEVHIAVLYLLQLDWISAEIKGNEGTLRPTLSFLGATSRSLQFPAKSITHYQRDPLSFVS